MSAETAAEAELAIADCRKVRSAPRRSCPGSKASLGRFSPIEGVSTLPASGGVPPLPASSAGRLHDRRLHCRLAGTGGGAWGRRSEGLGVLQLLAQDGEDLLELPFDHLHLVAVGEGVARDHQSRGVVVERLGQFRPRSQLPQLAGEEDLQKLVFWSRDAGGILGRASRRPGR